jgi:hypothetical protein
MFHGSKMQTDVVCMDGRINRSILSVNHIITINQSIYLSTNQSTNQPTKQPIKHIIISINLSIRVSVNYLQHQVELWLWLAWSCLQFLLIATLWSWPVKAWQAHTPPFAISQWLLSRLLDPPARVQCTYVIYHISYIIIYHITITYIIN